jgi:NodT family efflux transporter outer membrane factor (OMF) lipoprotein
MSSYAALKLRGGILVALLTLTGCSVGPNYKAPEALMPATWSGSKSLPLATDRQGWWRSFHDPLLNELIEQRAVSNMNLKIAQARVMAARSEYAIAFSQLFPKVSADLLPPNATGFDLTQLMALTASIEPDIFGKQREGRRRAQAHLEAAQAEQDFTLLNLQAEIATAYLELREAQTKNKIIYHNLGGNQQVLHFLKSKYKSGLTNYLNVAQQDALISTQLAELEQNSALVMMILHKIERLTGNNPGVLAKKLLPFKPVPQMTKVLHLGVPSELLRRRPDIVAAERRVAADHANIRVAMANLFPQMTVGWLLGWQTQTIASNIIAMQNPESTFFGVLTAPLFNLSLYRIVDLRKREEALAVIHYQMVVMQALHEVETQYNYCQHYKASASYLKHAVKQKQLALDLANNTYQKGAIDFSTVLRSEEELNGLETAYLHQLVIYQIAQINLHKALGG